MPRKPGALLQESARVLELYRLQLFDNVPEQRTGRNMCTVLQLFGVPIALIPLIDADCQWFKSSQGLSALHTPQRLVL